MDRAWRCCEFWQRRLSNKWNARLFARDHGCRVPDLYWHGRRVSRLPLESLPAQYVIRPARGYSGTGVYVMTAGTDLMNGERYANVRSQLVKTFGHYARVPLLVEELVTDESAGDGLPIEYHCHMFGERIGAIEVNSRTGRGPKKTMRNFYTEDWRPFPQPMRNHYPYGAEFAAPKCLAEILRCARTLGVAYETYVRIDFYASPRGCVFSEFAATPGLGKHFTQYCDEYFERLWRETFPDAI